MSQPSAPLAQPVIAPPACLAALEIDLPVAVESVARVHEAILEILSLRRRERGATRLEIEHAAFHTAVVEIATNIIRHAFPKVAESDQFRLGLRSDEHAVEAIFEDRGRPFAGVLSRTEEGREPRAILRIEDLPIEDLPEGGYGLDLARRSLDLLDYQRSDDCNVWRLVKNLP